MIKISLKGLAKFMTSNSAQQRKILKDYKYPDPEGKAQAIYYREAREFIVAYHLNQHPSNWLLEQSSILDSWASQSLGQTKTRLRYNANSLREYASHFGDKNFEILPDLYLYLSYAGITITIYPDLHVIERGKEKIIKLEFTKNKPHEKQIKIIGQVMFEAQSREGMGLTSASVLCYDVPRGTIHKGARVGSQIRREIEAACKNIADLWNGI